MHTQYKWRWWVKMWACSVQVKMVSQNFCILCTREVKMCAIWEDPPVPSHHQHNYRHAKHQFCHQLHVVVESEAAAVAVAAIWDTQGPALPLHALLYSSSSFFLSMFKQLGTTNGISQTVRACTGYCKQLGFPRNFENSYRAYICKTFFLKFCPKRKIHSTGNVK